MAIARVWFSLPWRRRRHRHPMISSPVGYRLPASTPEMRRGSDRLAELIGPSSDVDFAARLGIHAHPRWRGPSGGLGGGGES